MTHSVLELSDIIKEIETDFPEKSFLEVANAIAYYAWGHNAEKGIDVGSFMMKPNYYLYSAIKYSGIFGNEKEEDGAIQRKNWHEEIDYTNFFAPFAAYYTYYHKNADHTYYNFFRVCAFFEPFVRVNKINQICQKHLDKGQIRALWFSIFGDILQDKSMAPAFKKGGN